MINREQIEQRHAELVAARQTNTTHIAQLRAALMQAEQQDYGFAIAIGELERLLPDLAAPPVAGADPNALQP